MGSATKRPMHYWGRSAWVEPPLTRDEIELLPVSLKLLHLMIQEGGVWNSARTVEALQDHGWRSDIDYPANAAGNMLNRWVQRGVLVKLSRGQFTPRPVHMKEGQHLWTQNGTPTGTPRSDDFA